MTQQDALQDQQNAALELFQNGQLEDAIHAQIELVKADPNNENQRLFLFELLVLAGQWDRAGRQLAALDYPDAERGATRAVYRSLLDAERQRNDILLSGKSPHFLSDPPENVQRRVEALQHLVQGRSDEAAQILAQLDESDCDICGELNGTEFTLFRDCDDLFGSVLEALSSTGNYYWIPIQQIASLTVVEPRQLRDLAWLPATLGMRDGPTGDVFLPVRYPGSESHANNAIRLARATNWTSPEDGPVRGYGVRLYLVDDSAIAIPEWRTLKVN
jgi:type VI secretion system protein ImpE